MKFTFIQSYEGTIALHFQCQAEK